MKVRKLKNETANSFIKETLALITEKGGSHNVNLRDISKKVGCAHTNVYNYFDGFEGLLAAALQKVLIMYSQIITKGLSADMSGHDYFNKLFSNYISLAFDNPGLYRFLSADTFDYQLINEEHFSTVAKLKNFFYEAIYQLAKEKLNRNESNRITDILMTYADGEVLNFINERFLPGENIKGRIMDNLNLMFNCMTAKENDGIVLSKNTTCKKYDFPILKI